MENPQTDFHHDVFINCPFDKGYSPLFRALVFTIHVLDFRARCSLEMDSGEGRLARIVNLIGSCKYGIHDLSRIQQNHKLPRFNMPFELGIDVGFKSSGKGPYRTKNHLIMDSHPFRYRQFISDLSGRGLKAHYNQPSKVIEIIRNWLNDAVKNTDRYPLPGGNLITQEYETFCRHLPKMRREAGHGRNRITFNDYSFIVAKFIEERKNAARG
jgi:hypothetical protein